MWTLTWQCHCNGPGAPCNPVCWSCTVHNTFVGPVSAHHSTSASARTAPHPSPPSRHQTQTNLILPGSRQSVCGLRSQYPGADAASRPIILSSRNGIYHWARRAAYLLGHCIRVNQPGQSLHVQWAAGVWALPCCTQDLLVYCMIRFWICLGIKMSGMCPEYLQFFRHERCWLDCGFVAWDTLRNLSEIKMSKWDLQLVLFSFQGSWRAKP